MRLFGRHVSKMFTSVRVAGVLENSAFKSRWLSQATSSISVLIQSGWCKCSRNTTFRSIYCCNIKCWPEIYLWKLQLWSLVERLKKLCSPLSASTKKASFVAALLLHTPWIWRPQMVTSHIDKRTHVVLNYEGLWYHLSNVGLPLASGVKTITVLSTVVTKSS